jgi:nucleotide-binding universal stress UspA family protein
MRIFAATDLTPSGARVVDLAATLAAAVGGELLVAHVAALPPTPAPGDVGEEIAPAMDALRARLRERIEHATAALDRECVRASKKGVACESRLVEGHPWEVLVTEAAREGADIMVVGSHSAETGHGHGGMVGRLIGTTADRIVRHAPCPVLVAPEGPAPESLEGARWLVGVDFSPACRSAVQLTTRLARASSGRLMLAHSVATAPYYEGDDVAGGWQAVLREDSRKRAEQALRAMADEAADGAVYEGNHVTYGSAARELCQAARDTKADVLVVGNHGRGGVARLLLGSTAEKCLRYSPVPVLVVRTMDPGRA